MRRRGIDNPTTSQLGAIVTRNETTEYENCEGEALFTLSETSKLLNLEIGRTRFMALLKDWHLLVGQNEPSQSMIERGYMVYKLKSTETLPGLIPVTLVTIRGLAFLKRFIQRKLNRTSHD